MAVSGDAERLQTIQELELAITRKQPAVDSARAKRDEKRTTAAARGAVVGVINREITAARRR